MKYLISFLLVFVCTYVQAQDPVYVQMRSNYQYKGIKMDSLFVLPNLDTANAREVTGAVVRMGSAYYWYNGTAWVGLAGGGGATDTTSLSNRINAKADTSSLALKLNRSDSTLYQTKYRSDTARTNIYTAINTKLNKADTISLENRKVPYTGATQDVDLGNNGLDAKFIKITGTAGNGHIDFKHQASDASATGNSTALFANTSGYLKWKNDNLYYSTLAMPQTADRVYTYQNKSYTLADSADVSSKLNASDTTSLSNRINAKLNISDTANMLASYLREADTLSLSNRIDLKLNISDTTSMLAPYLREADTASLSNRINARVLISDTSSMLTNYQRTSAFPIATFGAGSGAAGDTSAFSTAAIYGSFYLNAGSDTIIVTGYTGVVQGTSASVTPTIYFNDTLNVAGTKIVNSPSAVTSTTTGNTVTSLDNTKIPPGNFVWVKTETVTTKPTYFNLTLIGYRKR